MFIGRMKELKEADKIIKDRKKKGISSFFVVKGRRRIGKSTFIEEVAKKQKLILLNYAGKEGDNEDAQKLYLISQITIDFPNFKSATDWHSILTNLSLEMSKSSENFLLLFDEISWLSDNKNSFVAELKTVWDNKFKKQNIVLFLCGSVSSWINKEVINGSSLQGRIDHPFTLEGLSIKDAKKFWKHGIKPLELAKILSAIGTIPRYLELIDTSETAEVNLNRLFFSGGTLFDEYGTLLKSSFEKEKILHQKIIDLLSSKKMTYTEIREKLNNNIDTQETLDEMEQGGFIDREANFLSDSEYGQLYSIKDNYILFYLSFVKKHEYAIRKGKKKINVSLETLLPWSTVCGLMFENLLRANADLILNAVSLPSECQYGSLAIKGDDKEKGAQIDLLIKDQHDNYFISEFKMKKSISYSVVKDFENKSKALDTKLKKKVKARTILVYGGDLTPKLKNDDSINYKIDFFELIDNL